VSARWRLPDSFGGTPMIFGFDIVVVAIVVLAILVFFAGVKTIPQGYNYTVERFGRYTRTSAPR
jgi:regulator of protease activity HflC (stomatin/prohibitin superfamily)